MYKLENMNKALDTMREIIELHNKKTNDYVSVKIPYDALTDSIVCRFKYSVNLFFNVLHMYLVDFEKVNVQSDDFRATVRCIVEIGFCSEDEGLVLMDMISARNKVPEMYQQSIAQELVNRALQFYEQMHTIVQKVQENIT